jgi:YVTN family beta-propeller protein
VLTLLPRLGVAAGAILVAAAAVSACRAGVAAPVRDPVAKIELGGPGGFVVPAVGAVWATDTVSRLVRIDPATNAVAGEVSAGVRPLGLAYGAGSLWVASSISGRVLRIDPARQKVVKRIAPGLGPRDVTYGAGAVWVTNESGGTVARIKPRTNKVVARIRGFRQPNGVTYAFGSIWVGELAGGRVTRVDPRRNRIVRRVAVPAADWITASPDSLWISSERGKVYRLDPATMAVKAVVSVGANPLGSAWIDGELWVPNIDDDTISIVDPSTNTVRTTLHVGDGPISIALADGDVWVTHERDPLWRLHRSG